eukprot:6796134-Pyramimonas_sp.AAC.1
MRLTPKTISRRTWQLASVTPPATNIGSITLKDTEDQPQQLYQEHISFCVVVIMIARRCARSERK